MSDRAFVDTNVLVYAFDSGEPTKQEAAHRLLASPPGPLVISAQVLGEFYTVVTRRLARPLPAAEAQAAVEHLARLPVLPIDHGLVRAAIATSRRDRISYWDALIVESAGSAGCKVLFTEDLNASQEIRGVRVVNPFEAPASG